MGALQRMYRRKELANMLGLNLKQLDRWIDQKDGPFPQPHRIGRTLWWFEDELVLWQAKARANQLGDTEKEKK